MPLLRMRLAVEWQSATIAKGDDAGTHGCLYPEARAIGNVNGVTGADYKKQIIDLLSSGPHEFSGTFEEALKEMSAKGTDIKNGQTIDKPKTASVIGAVNKGIADWSTTLQSYFPATDRPAEVTQILANLTTYTQQLATIQTCLAPTPPPATSTPGGTTNALPTGNKTKQPNTSVDKLAEQKLGQNTEQQNLTASANSSVCEIKTEDGESLVNKTNEINEELRKIRKMFWPTYDGKLFEPIENGTITLQEMSSWEDSEDEVGEIKLNSYIVGESELLDSDIAECVGGTNPPELTPTQISEYFYYEKIAVDMNPCPKSYKGYPTTYTSPTKIPRNIAFYWHTLLERQNKGGIVLLSETNKARVLANDYKSITIDEVWIKECPKHAQYLGEAFAHHHIDRLNMASAIPQKFHTTYNKYLHWGEDVLVKVKDYCSTNNIPINKGKLAVKTTNMAFNVLMFWDFAKAINGDPTAAWNLFRTPNEKGILYYITEKNCFVMIYYLQKDAQKATIRYKLYRGYTYDNERKKYIGVDEYEAWEEEYNVITKKTKVSLILEG